MPYEEHLEAIKCPKCGSIEWKRLNLISCNWVPFKVECAKCGYMPDEITTARLCPLKEFSYRFPNQLIIRHLRCLKCGKEELSFTMRATDKTEGKNVVSFGKIKETESYWELPVPWVSGYYEIEEDGVTLYEQTIFCSKECRDTYNSIL